MVDFQFKTYRCEWVSEVFPVDQYDRRTKEPELYIKAFPTYEEAYDDLMFVTKPHPYVSGRRVYEAAPHDFYSTTVRYREMPVKEEENGNS